MRLLQSLFRAHRGRVFLLFNLALGLFLCFECQTVYSVQRRPLPPWRGKPHARPLARPLVLPCDTAKLDRNVYAAGLGHDTFNAFYRTPFGAVKTSQGTVRIRFRTCHQDVDRVRLRVWDQASGRELWFPLSLSADSQGAEVDLGPVDYWSVNLPVPVRSSILYYFFEVSDGGDTHYYVSHGGLRRGGWGRYSVGWNDADTFQIAIYDQDFHVPQWLQGAVIYHLLPDRFRNGDPANDPAEGSGFVFGRPMHIHPWNKPLCDPRGVKGAPGSCPGETDNQFYGGDLQGVTQKLNDLQELGVNAIYMNPIFLSSTNHRYDSQDYFTIDPKLGGFSAFQQLIGEAHRRGIRVILDGVFNHGSADSPYFDLFRRWSNANGACWDLTSPFRNWFYFPHFVNRPVDHSRPGVDYFCQGGSGTLTTYEAWWGYYEHPVYRKYEPAVHQFFYGARDKSVAGFWLNQGTSGWRLDVGGDVDPGETHSSSNQFWRGFRSTSKTINPDSVIIGEEWASATPWLLGHNWDSATNYRFRSALLNWLSDGCSGVGCHNGIYEDDNHNLESPSGPIAPITESAFDYRLRGIQEDYPPESWMSMLNLLGSHDTQRVLFILRKISRDNPEIARRKLMLAVLFQFTYPGAPVIYYGDEVGVDAPGRFYDGRLKSDPYSRVTYPWTDLRIRNDSDLRMFFKRMAQLRNSLSALRFGFIETLLTDDARRAYAYRRFDGRSQVWTVLNRSLSSSRIILPIASRQLPEGAVLVDLLSGSEYVVSQGAIDCGEIPTLWGRVLVLKGTVKRSR